MSDITRVALDAMGGDNAPGEIVKGAVEAVQRRKDIKILLTGQEDRLKKELSGYTYPDDQIEIVNATEVIETAEPPVKAIRGKKDSSIVVAMKMVKKRRSGCVCVCRKHRCSPCRRTGSGWKDQGSGKTAACTASSDTERSVAPD